MFLQGNFQTFLKEYYELDLKLEMKKHLKSEK
jgi:hypothetical protein